MTSGSWRMDYGTGSNDLVVVHGMLTLGAGSRLEINRLAPAATDELVIAEYQSLSGMFAQTTGLPAGAAVDYRYGPARNQIAIIKRGTMLLLR